MKVASKIEAKKEALAKKTIIPFDQQRIPISEARRRLQDPQNNDLRKQELDKFKRQFGPELGIKKFMELLRYGE
jgi:hypothetical protein